ncbi:hypothetical protein ACFLRZ_00460 [Bacteroidota bacterium]
MKRLFLWIVSKKFTSKVINLKFDFQEKLSFETPSEKSKIFDNFQLRGLKLIQMRLLADCEVVGGSRNGVA